MPVQRTAPDETTGVSRKGLRVEVAQGPDRGRSHYAASDTITVGTAGGNDLVLTDDTVSRYHVELVRRPDHVSVLDLGSTNGVVLGQALLAEGAVAPGVTLILGRTHLRVRDGDTVQVELHDEDTLGGLRGQTPQMRTLMANVNRAVASDAPVLLLGEAGVGKELTARVLHRHGRRADRPFEVVDGGALIPAHTASALFGHEKGALPGAERPHVGAFERADGGTLFIREVGELSAALQSGLLGALERQSFRRLGGSVAIRADVRLVCATRRDLRRDVNAGRFRQDLYERIAKLTLKVPPLRERTDDIPLLVEHFAREAGHHGALDDIIPSSLRTSLKHRYWPGNVRALRDFVDAAVAAGADRR